MGRRLGLIVRGIRIIKRRPSKAVTEAVKKIISKKKPVSVKKLPAKSAPSVRSVDVGTKTKSRVGGFDIRTSPSGRSTISNVRGISKSQAMALATKSRSLPTPTQAIRKLPIKKLPPIKRPSIIKGRKIETLKKKVRKEVITPLSERQKRLIDIEKKKQAEKKKAFERGEAFKPSLKSEREALKSFSRNVEIAGLTVGKSIIQNTRAIKNAPKDIKEIAKTIREDPSSVKKLVKDLPKVLKQEGKVGLELFKTSPTEAIALVGGNVLFFAGTGKALKLVGKVAKTPAKAIKKVAKGKKGTKVKFIGTQSIKGNIITTKVIFKTNGKELGGAIGKSRIKGKRIFTQTAGKVGTVKIKKIKGRTTIHKFKTKGVFVGREISKAKRKKFRLRTEVSGIGSVSRNIEGISQVGLGRVASARGEKLLSTVIKFPTGQLKKKKVKSLRVKDFISASRILSKGDLNLIVGKTLTKKKDITEFIGLIKGTSRKDISKFSSQKQKLFKQALKDVAGTISASTTRSKKIIPKLSPKGKKVILKRISGKISKGKVIIGVKVIQRVKTRVKVKPRLKSRIKLEEKLKNLQKQKTTMGQISKLSQKQKTRLTTLQKQINVLKSKGVIVPISIRPKTKIGLIKKRKKKIERKPVRKKKEQAFNVFARPLKKTKKGKRPKLIKVNDVPLSKKKAESLRNLVADTSLSRTARIKPTKGKPSKSKIKIPASFSKKTKKKFRTHRIIKGKRKPLPKGTVIEKRKRLLDTPQEKRGITLRRRIKQISPKPKKSKKIKPSRTTKKRSPSQAQLSALAKGRKKRLSNLRKR